MRTAKHENYGAFHSKLSRIGILTCCCVAAMMAHTRVAAASCNSRPGTPTNVTAEALSSTSIKFNWRNTTGRTLMEPRMYFDMYMRDGANRPIGKDLTGTGPFDVSYGSISSKTFDDLAPNSRYCFSLRARTGRGTQGCISAITSNVACATTLAAGATPVHPPSPPPPAAIVINARIMPGNVDRKSVV